MCIVLHSHTAGQAGQLKLLAIVDLLAGGGGVRCQQMTAAAPHTGRAKDADWRLPVVASGHGEAESGRETAQRR
jgi:hypothetical protein